MDTKTTHDPGDLAEFIADVFASLPRTDQRTTSSYYLQGLMLEGRRKSMQPMADRLGIDHQRLQQFVSTSPWKVEPVRQALATKAINLIHADAWVVDDTGFIKDGHASPRSSQAVLRHPGKSRQRPNRRQRARRDRRGLLPAELAIIPAPQLG